MSATFHKGRGAASREPGRFATTAVAPDPDIDMPATNPDTTFTAMTARSIISSNQSPDIPFDQSINPYLGCEHGCVYCYARPAHSYLDLSPGLDFETRIYYKPNAAAVLVDEWQKSGYVCKPITIGANTDPYQPAEKKLGLTRRLLETFLAHHHPVSIISKGVMMERDLDLLRELAEKNLVSIAISVPTADNELKRVLEPRVPAASARFRLIRLLKDGGIPVSLLMAPIIPVINDREIESIVEQAANAGVESASWILLRLPHELKQIFREWLELHMPDRAAHVMSQLRQASGGKDYDNRYGIRQRGRGPYAEMIDQRFRAACKRYGIGTGRRRQSLDCSQFLPPGQQQMTLGFD